jgi:hypothetical protein
MPFIFVLGRTRQGHLEPGASVRRSRGGIMLDLLVAGCRIGAKTIRWIIMTFVGNF